jgi:hypothetical protein
MAEFDFEDVLRLCHGVSNFSRQANWKWKGFPVIQWEFPTIKEFATARLQIEQILRPEMYKMSHDGSWARIVDPETFEVDCYNVTFRLICREKLKTPQAVVGAAEMIYITDEEHERRLKRRDRK